MQVTNSSLAHARLLGKNSFHITNINMTRYCGEREGEECKCLSWKRSRQEFTASYKMLLKNYDICEISEHQSNNKRNNGDYAQFHNESLKKALGKCVLPNQIRNNGRISKLIKQSLGGRKASASHEAGGTKNVASIGYKKRLTNSVDYVLCKGSNFNYRHSSIPKSFYRSSIKSSQQHIIKTILKELNPKRRFNAYMMKIRHSIDAKTKNI